MSSVVSPSQNVPWRKYPGYQAKEITSWTEKLSRVRRMLASGWRDNTDAELKPYQQRHTQLSLHDGCVMWGSRVVIPPPGRERILEELHEGHPGISKMKSLARCFVWWPRMDKARKSSSWEWPEHPWARLHIDYLFSDTCSWS